MNYKLVFGIGIVVIAIIIFISSQETKINNVQNSTSSQITQNSTNTQPQVVKNSTQQQGKQLQLTLDDSVGIKAK